MGIQILSHSAGLCLYQNNENSRFDYQTFIELKNYLCAKFPHTFYKALFGSGANSQKGYVYHVSYMVLEDSINEFIQETV